MSLQCCLCETKLGVLGVAWGAHGLARLLLPAASASRTEAGLRRLLPEAAWEEPGGPVRDWLDLICRYALGERADFGDVPVDLGGTDAFRRDIYAAARQVGFGRTATYGELAALAGHPGLARETGQALARNPVPLVVPCHRILAAGNRIGGFSAPGGAGTKLRLLELEGIALAPTAAQSSFAF